MDGGTKIQDGWHCWPVTKEKKYCCKKNKTACYKRIWHPICISERIALRYWFCWSYWLREWSEGSWWSAGRWNDSDGRQLRDLEEVCPSWWVEVGGCVSRAARSNAWCSSCSCCAWHASNSSTWPLTRSSSRSNFKLTWHRQERN